jgi:hypothetical protein
MTNQEKLNEYILKYPDSLEEIFGYHAAHKIADDILEASDAGKHYATLKFLQKYCTPVNVLQLNVSGFRYGDPRKYSDLKSVINDWEFVVAGGVVIDDNESKSQKENEPDISINLQMEQLMELTRFPDYYQQYSWNGKHKLFGYPSDSYSDFHWINSLEKRFIWLCNNSEEQNTASKYLIQEMIEWGGSQNGVLQKFNDGSGEVNLLELVQEIIDSLDSPERAITNSLSLPGLGLTYASKLLRFMKPEKYGALDSRIRGALLKGNLLRKINDGNFNSMVNGYLEFLKLLNNLKSQLEDQRVKKPDCSLSNTGLWRPSEIEMALFRWAELQ